MTLYGGNHDWVHVDDFCRAVKLVNDHAELLNGLAINVGSGRSITNQEVVDTVGLVTGRPIKICPVPPKPQDSHIWVADNGKIRSLGWKPKISLYEGIKRVYESQRASLGN